MRNFLILLLVTFTSIASNAQRVARPAATAGITGKSAGNMLQTLKVTGSGDTSFFSNITSSDTLATYLVGSSDSGYYTGTNFYNDMGFAERFDFNKNDSSVAVIGILAQFTGTVSDSSTNSLTFRIWSVGAPMIADINTFYSGYPTSVLDSMVVPFSQLGIGNPTATAFYFPPPWINVGSPFFAGFTMNYNFNSLNGDTIGIQSSLNGERITPAITVDTTITGADTTYDTTIFVQNVTMWSDGNWYDNYTQNDSLLNDLAIYPIVVIGNPSGVNSISRSGLTFYGASPNPAIDHTNISFCLTTATSVSLQLMDAAGRVQYQADYRQADAGKQSISVPTSNLTAGNYICLIRTGSGAGFATQLAVVH